MKVQPGRSLLPLNTKGNTRETTRVDSLIEKSKSLPPEQLAKVADFVDLLHMKNDGNALTPPFAGPRVECAERMEGSTHGLA